MSAVATEKSFRNQLFINGEFVDAKGGQTFPTINPATMKMSSGRKLEGKDLKEFFAERERLESLEASLPVQHKLAQTVADKQIEVR